MEKSKKRRFFLIKVEMDVKDSRGRGIKDSSEMIKALKIIRKQTLEPSDPGILEPCLTFY